VRRSGESPSALGLLERDGINTMQEQGAVKGNDEARTSSQIHRLSRVPQKSRHWGEEKDGILKRGRHVSKGSGLFMAGGPGLMDFAL